MRNDPYIIGNAVRCRKCGWLFRCPSHQPDRLKCYACTPVKKKQWFYYRDGAAVVIDPEAEKAIFNNGPEPSSDQPNNT